MGKQERLGMKVNIKQLIKLIDSMSGVIYIIGNGGAASSADHFACDMVKRNRVKAVSLCSNTATLTAYANDNEKKDLFIEQLKTLFNPERDILIALTTSGESKNILSACEYVYNINGVVVIITGEKNYMADILIDYDCIFVGDSTQQECEDNINIACHEISNELLKYV